MKVRRRYVIIGVIVAACVIGLIFAGYRFNWTGFDGYNQVTTAHIISGTNAGTITRTEEYQPGKNLWDWLQLLFIPAVLTLGAVWISSRQSHDLEITADNQRETALQAYIDSISELLLKEHLGELTTEGKPKPEYEEIRIIARVRTLTVLPLLNAKRKRSVLLFLHDSHLIDKDNAFIGLQGADLNGADLSRANLSKADLSDADLSGANLSKADLSDAYLNEANLSKADLSKAELSGASLRDATLFRAQLQGAWLSGAQLQGAWLLGAQLQEAFLYEADLSGAELNQANLHNAKNITTEKLEKQTKSLKGAIMPDGKKHP